MGAVRTPSFIFILIVLIICYLILISDDDATELQKQRGDNNVGNSTTNSLIGQNPFLDIPESSTAIEYKKGYVMRKCCYDANYKKSKSS